MESRFAPQLLVFIDIIKGGISIRNGASDWADVIIETWLLCLSLNMTRFHFQLPEPT